MPSIGRRLAGAKAQRIGLSFERVFQDVCKAQGIDCERIPDSCKQIGKNRLIRTPSPFDFVIGRDGKAFFIDTKTSNSPTFSYSQIKQHQLDAFKRLRNAGMGGYIIHTSLGVYFASWTILDSVKPGQGVPFDICIRLGDIYSFDLGCLFTE